MILDDLVAPMLLLSVDSVPELSDALAEARINADPVLSSTDPNIQSVDLVQENRQRITEDSQISVANGEVTTVNNSDGALNWKRLPIIFSDGITPAHVVGISSSSSSQLSTIGDTQVVYGGTQILNISIRMSSTLSEIGSLANILIKLSDLLYSTAQEKGIIGKDGTYEKVRQTRVTAKCSFFSPTFTLMEGYLTGINRSSVAGSTVETVTLTIEQAPPKKKEAKPNKKPTKVTAATEAGTPKVQPIAGSGTTIPNQP